METDSMVIASALLWATMLALPAEPVASDTACIHHATYPIAGRPSPLDSITFLVSGKPVKVCYGRPSARGRKMFGGELHYGDLWRTGANEPTIIMTPIALSFAGINVPPGKYSIYSVPGETEWEIIVNSMILRSGHVMWYTIDVKNQELGRGKVKSKTLSKPLETFTMRADPSLDNAKALVLEWEKTSVPIPITAR